MTFCDKCKNLLNVNTTNGVLTFKCMTCFSIYDSTDDDTLRYEETKGSNIVLFQTILNNSVNDDTVLKSFSKCPKCKHNISKDVRLGNELRLIHNCEKCKFQWIDV